MSPGISGELGRNKIKQQIACQRTEDRHPFRNAAYAGEPEVTASRSGYRTGAGVVT